MARLQATAILITSRHKKLLEGYLRKQTRKQHYDQRIQIVLMAAESKANNVIGKEIGMKNDTVRRWRDRWALENKVLLIYEKGANDEGISDSQLLKRMLDILSDEQRPGAPCRISLS